MQAKTLLDSKLRWVGEYLIAIILCLVVLTMLLKLWRADLRTPMEYGGDALFHGMVIKGMIDNGWYMTNDYLGMPGKMELWDFPVTENFHMIVIKVMTIFIPHHTLVLNLYFLLTFPLTTIASLYVFRQFKISYAPALFCSLLYAFAPFHFLRNQHHLFLAAYYLLPLMILVMLWVSSGMSLFREGTKRSWSGLNLRSPKVVFSIIVCALIGSSGVYYPFFSCFLLLIAGSSASIMRRSVGPLITATVLVAVIVFFVFVNLAPSIVYTRQHGQVSAMARWSGEAEAYGLKIAQLVLPITDHRVRAVARLKARYNKNPLVNENDDASLGLIASIGFLFLIGRMLFRRGTNEDLEREHAREFAGTRELLNHLSVLNLSALLLATIGGFGSVFAILISPRIRTYNRISIFIAFFSLFAIALLLENFLRRRLKSEKARAVFYAALAVIFLLGVLDQTGKAEYYRPNYEKVKSLYEPDADFVRRIEASLPPRAMIFQLPYARFPEQGTIERMGDYSHFRGYLNARSLRWSYGAMRGRDGDRWQEAISSQTTSEMVKRLAFAGFEGIYIDREGYSDNGALIESELSTLLGTRPLASSNKKLIFFSLTEYSKQLREQYMAEAWEANRRLALYPPMADWGNGCSTLEKVAENDWRWCQSQGELRIINNSQQTTHATLEMTLATGYAEPSSLQMESPLFSETVEVNKDDRFFSKEITIPPGTFTIKFTSDAPRVHAPNDPRFLVFKIGNFRLRTKL